MATDFWTSSHYKHWLVDRLTLRRAREDDFVYATEREIGLITIFFANVIARLGKRLEFRQQVTVTAIVYFRRFYLRNLYCETDPFFVAAACCYVAAKAEEAPCHLKSVVSEARTLFSGEWGINNFPSDHTKLGEMEFYLLEELQFHLVVYHPYRDLANLCGKAGSEEESDVPKNERFWGTGKGKLIMEEGAIQTAWFIISDSYRTELCLLQPPYIIAIAALYMTCVLHSSISTKLHPLPAIRNMVLGTASKRPRSPASPVVRDIQRVQGSDLQSQSSSSSSSSPNSAPSPSQGANLPPGSSPTADSTNLLGAPSPRDEIINFLAGLNISLELISNVCQQMMSMYDLWDSFTDHSDQDRTRREGRAESHREFLRHRRGAGAAPTWSSMPNGVSEATLASILLKDKELVTDRQIVEIVQRMRREREHDLAFGRTSPSRPVKTQRDLQ